MLSQICWVNQLSDSRNISYYLNLILAHNHSHRFTSVRLKNRPLSLLEVVLAEGNKLPLYPSTETVDRLWQNCQLTANKLNKDLYSFVVLKDMEPQHQVSPPNSSKSEKDKTEYEQNDYIDLLPFANRALVPIHPRFIDFLVSMPEGIELLNRDCGCTNDQFTPNGYDDKLVCKCTPSDRLHWHHEKRIKRLLCASLFEHRFLLPSLQDIRPIYKKHVQLIESSKELCHFADLVEGDDDPIMHLRVVVPRPTVPPTPPPPAGALPKQCTSIPSSTSLPAEAETVPVPVPVPVPKAGTWPHHPNSTTTAQGSSTRRGTRGPIKASTIPSSSARTQTQAAPASYQSGASSMSREGTSWGGSGKKEGWFPREWVGEFSRETMGPPWERFWGIFTSGKSRSRELASSVVELRNQREVDKGASKVETQEQQEGRKMETKVLMEDTSTNKRRRNTPENTSRRTEMEGRGYDQLDVLIDSRPPPPQYQS